MNHGPAIPLAMLRRVALVWLVVGAVQLIANAGAIAHMRFPDPDDSLRLVQVRDLLAGQGWFDLHAHRVDPLDGGVLMHWSRLVDLPIAAVIWTLRPLLGQADAELAALIAVPMVTLGVVLALVGRLAFRKAGAEGAVLACMIAALSVPVMVQLRPLRIDHHGWQIVAALVGLGGLMARDRRIGGWVAGAGLALGLGISIEGLPVAIGFAGIGAWRWLRGEGPQWLTRYLGGLALGSALVFAATRGLADLAEHCDAISPVHLAIFAFAALVVGARAVMPRSTATEVFLGLAGAGAGAMAIMWLMAPQCTRGACVALDPVVRQLWLEQISEGLPIWRQDWATALGILVPALVGLMVAWDQAMRRSGEERRWWQDYACAQAAALVVACLVARAGGVSCAFAALPLAVGLGRWLGAARSAPAGRSAAMMAGAALVLMPALPVTLAAMVPPLFAAKAGPAPRPAARVADCDIRGDASRLAALGPVNLLAPLDIGPQLLLAAPNVTVLATSHHRGAPAMREVIDAFTAPEPAAHAIMQRRHIGALVLCQGLAEPALYAHVAPSGLAARLQAGDAPSWLVPVPQTTEGMRIWRVVN